MRFVWIQGAQPWPLVRSEPAWARIRRRERRVTRWGGALDQNGERQRERSRRIRTEWDTIHPRVSENSRTIEGSGRGARRTGDAITPIHSLSHLSRASWPWSRDPTQQLYIIKLFAMKDPQILAFTATITISRRDIVPVKPLLPVLLFHRARHCR